ncbi:MAG TPA: hypothetical protein VLZ28_07615 [Daejeonella sp.]|nr:hypothetical protein [Daejeonella sp.]
MKYCGCAFLILLTLWLSSCKQEPVKAFQTLPFFSDVRGIQFTEVRRAFDNGLSFDTTGFQLEPAWRMKFLSDDTVRLYNPLEDRSYNFHVHYDHDSVINMARVWLRVKKVTKDSLKFQLLQVEGRNVSSERSNIFMTFYADSYIKNKLGTTAEELRKPKKNDSLFVRRKIKEAVNRPKAAFAARTPVELSSKSPAIKVKKVKVEADFLSAQGLSEEYMSPEFNIIINPAYKDFNYSFTVTVDTHRRMHFGKSTVYMMPEFVETYNRVMKGIMEVYLQNLLNIQPGETLGIAHPSEITVNVKGVGKK